MLHIHFTADDRARLRLAERADPLWETVLSLHQMIRPDPFFAAWRRRTGAGLAAAGAGADLRLLTTLAPRSSYFPDFLTPSDDDGHPPDVGTGIDRVLSTGKGRLRTEIGRLASGMPRPPAWLDDFAAGRPRALHRLGDALRRYHAVALAPHADRVAADVRRDRNDRARRVLRHGGEAVLGALGASARWRPPVLEVDYPTTQHLRLDGRGLTLVPSFFLHDHPIALADPSLPPVLTFPVSRGPLWIPGHARREEDGGGRAGTALDDLLGPTRAAVLRSLDTRRTTSALADRLRVSPSAASRHATTLRRAGLVDTERRGGAVLHSRTALGTALVHGT
ncbi:winged helix-turn-helix domain-containing protein [Streptomyces sp. DSM 42041]|uniref:Winged helix-turn-helix domain-containing protein n=1 Tax=Streptomyces hazeniae TaxID=3075538 RepID=A0ABU2NNR9_9ACTN|nr:winged helix-turn-helix domain-containing protein [Streptomyces sp. DSM 42041]MDT0378635.1 winged helix-turn-helix domain-containing protein [Streptomyces sp. DSM 42041]